MRSPLNIFLPSLSEGLGRKRLRIIMSVFFLALAIPTLVLIRQAYSQLKWEAFHQHRVLAEELATRIDRQLLDIIDAEEERSFVDYSFLIVSGDPAANFLQRSPLSTYPLDSDIPGLVGYFQIDATDVFSTPLLPQPPGGASLYGISAPELDGRQRLQSRIQEILSKNRLVSRQVVTARDPRRDTGGGGIAERGQGSIATFSTEASPISEKIMPREKSPLPSQAAFDRLSESGANPVQKKAGEPVAKHKLGRVEDLALEDIAKQRPGVAAVPATKSELRIRRAARKEQNALPISPEQESDTADAEEQGEQVPARIKIFESEIDPFEVSLLDSGHFVLYRKVWRDGQRYIQGILIEQQPFIYGLVGSAYLDTALSNATSLAVAFRNNVLAGFSSIAGGDRYLTRAAEFGGALLYRTGLSAPFGDLELVFSITRLPAGPGGKVIGWSAVIIILVLCGGTYLMYRLGLRQMALAEQQRDFVSAVSHELKTPLTSIRMYGEMLREGWAGEEKKKEYYDFIYSESERLSRLIENVLQLARMTRNDLHIELKPHSVAELIDNTRSKIISQVERAGFSLTFDCRGETAEAIVRVDADIFAQIMINLVDNAIKFSAKGEQRKIDIGAVLLSGGEVMFTVRDYGPGIPGNQMKRIFTLFYRSENELTRETVGTGIGLALVQQLTRLMGGKVDVINRAPGAEFRVVFAAVPAAVYTRSE